MERALELLVNGARHQVDDRHAQTPLLWVLRDVLGVRSVKFGCGGFCAACTVLVDRRAVKSCQQAAGRAVGKQVQTAEALAGDAARAVRDAWYRLNVVQCGYCQPGQVAAATALLSRTPEPDDAAIDAAISGNLCRCGTYPRIRAAIHAAAGQLKDGEAADPVPAVSPGPQPAFDTDDPIGAYLMIGADGTVNVACSQLEMGQGVHTGLATIVARELDASPASIRVFPAASPSGRYDNVILGGGLQQTGSSTSTMVFWNRYRQVAAAARARLVAAAAAQWHVPPGKITITAGVVAHPDGHRATLGELAAAAAALPPPRDAAPRPLDGVTHIEPGTALRVDSPGKIWGTAPFTIDVSWPDTVTAVVVHPPRFGGFPAAVRDVDARAVPGVIDIISTSNGVAVVAETFFDATQGARVLAVDWDESAAETRGTDELREDHLRLASGGADAVTALAQGDVDTAMASAARVIELVTDVPYLAHAPMEPNNATCRMRRDGVVEIWVGTQSADFVRLAVCDALALPADQVDVQTTYAGGAFGLRLAADCAVDTAEIARALGWNRAVKVQSSRTEEFKSGHFRPMAAVRVRAGLDAAGDLIAFDHRVVSQSIAASIPVMGEELRKGGFDLLQVLGAIDMPYAIPSRRVEAIEFSTKIPVATWRGIGNVHNVFAVETAIDEIASALGSDPVEFRAKLMSDSPRARKVLDLAAQRAGWSTPPPGGHGRAESRCPTRSAPTARRSSTCPLTSGAASGSTRSGSSPTRASS